MKIHHIACSILSVAAMAGACGGKKNTARNGGASDLDTQNSSSGMSGDSTGTMGPQGTMGGAGTMDGTDGTGTMGGTGTTGTGGTTGPMSGSGSTTGTGTGTGTGTPSGTGGTP